jgi:hypothetical protein
MAYQVYGRQNRSPFNRSWADFFRGDPEDSPREPKSTGYTVFGQLKRPRAVQPGSLAVSVSLHALLFLMLIGVVHRQQQQAKERPKETQAPVLFYVPPPPPRPPPPPAELFIPPPPSVGGAETAVPHGVPPGAPNSAPAEESPSAESPPAAEQKREEVAAAVPIPGITEAKPPSTAEAAQGKKDIESATQDLMRKLSRGTSEEKADAWNPTFGKQQKCPTLEELTQGGDTMGVFRGYVYGDRRGIPIPNAHLQVLNEHYETWSDSKGYFLLRLPMRLATGCRSPTVTVTAPGYPPLPPLVLSPGDEISYIYFGGR